MLQTMKTRLTAGRDNEEGFTLIELMVVVLIIAILLAIAIPTFLGAQNKAKDRSAQSSLRNAVTAAKTIYSDGQDYALATGDTYNTATPPAVTTQGTLSKVEPALQFFLPGTASTGPKAVSVDGGTTPSAKFYAAAKSATGTCFFIKDDLTAAGGGTWFGVPGSADACSGTGASSSTTAVWKQTGW